MLWIHYAMVSYRLSRVGRNEKITHGNYILLHVDKLVDKYRE